MRAAGAILLAIICSSVGAWASPARGAWDQVWRSDAATPSISGVVKTTAVGEEGERSASARVSAQGGKLRLDYETPRRRWSLIDDGRHLIRLDPAKQRALVLPRPTLAVDHRLAERNYQAQVTGRGTVAGRSVEIVEIASRRRGDGRSRAVIWRLWLDRETSLALKRERYNAEGKLVSSTEYGEVRFGGTVDQSIFAVPPGWQVVDADGDGERLTLQEIERRLGFAVLPPKYLPTGYVLIGTHVRQRGRWEFDVAELRYTDGLRILSVFQREHDRAGPGEGERHRRGRGRDRGHDAGPPPARRPGPPPGPPEGGREGRREGRHGGARGPGSQPRDGFGPREGEEMTSVDRGSEKVLRYLGEERVVIVVGDLAAEELTRVARSVEQ